MGTLSGVPHVLGTTMSAKIPDFSLGDFTKGLSLPFQGLRFLFGNRGLKRYAALPLLLNILVYGLGIALVFYYLWNWELSLAAWDFWGPVGRWLAAVVNWLGWLVKLVIFMLALALSFFTFTAVGMALASPLNDILSEKVESTYIGGIEKMELPLQFTVKAGLLSFGDSMRTLVRQLVSTVLVLPFLLVPVIGFAPLFMVGAYFAGFGFLDSAMARNFLRPAHKKLLVRRRFWQVLGFGTAMQALFAIPGLGMFLMPIGVTAGTLLYCREDWDALLKEAGMPKPNGFSPPRRSAPPIPGE